MNVMGFLLFRSPTGKINGARFALCRLADIGGRLCARPQLVFNPAHHYYYDYSQIP